MWIFCFVLMFIFMLFIILVIAIFISTSHSWQDFIISAILNFTYKTYFSVMDTSLQMYNIIMESIIYKLTSLDVLNFTYSSCVLLVCVFICGIRYISFFYLHQVTEKDVFALKFIYIKVTCFYSIHIDKARYNDIKVM